MEEIRLFILEDMADWVDIMTRSLEGSAYQLLGTSATISGAIDQIPMMVERGCNVITLDGNLIDGKITERLGKGFLKMIKAALPEIRFVGMSGGDIKEVGLDLDIGKFNFKSDQLATQLRQVINRE